MYQRILIAVDGGTTSELAMEEAVRLTTGQPSQLRLLHVVDAKMPLGQDSDFTNRGDPEKTIVESGRRILQKAAASAGNAGIKVETKLLEIEDFSQRLAEMIVGEAAAWPADLIVVGTHGPQSHNHLFRRKVAEDIVRLSPVPVLAIPGR